MASPTGIRRDFSTMVLQQLSVVVRSALRSPVIVRRWETL